MTISFAGRVAIVTGSRRRYSITSSAVNSIGGV